MPGKRANGLTFPVMRLVGTCRQALRSCWSATPKNPSRMAVRAVFSAEPGLSEIRRWLFEILLQPTPEGNSESLLPHGATLLDCQVDTRSRRDKPGVYRPMNRPRLRPLVRCPVFHPVPGRVDVRVAHRPLYFLLSVPE